MTDEQIAEDIVQKLTLEEVAVLEHHNGYDEVHGIPEKEQIKNIIVKALRQARSEWEKEHEDTVFINHIQKHLDEQGITSHEGKVICKICDKTVEQIYKEEGKDLPIEKALADRNAEILKALTHNCHWQTCEQKVWEDRVKQKLNLTKKAR